MKDEEKTISDSGATSSGKKPRFDQLPPSALRRIAERARLGVEKHGERNWEKGLFDNAFMKDRFNHAVDHLIQAGANLFATNPQERTAIDEDHLAAAALNCIFLMGYEQASEKDFLNDHHLSR